MRRPATAGVVACVLAVALGGAVYGFRLGDSPPYLGLDEAHFGNHAYSLATTAHDLNGNALPLFISLEDPLGDRPALPWGTTWYHPYGFYLIASVLTVAPISEAAIRAPFVMIGALNLVLIYLVARRWYGSRVMAIGAAALLAMTPAHFILSRLAFDYILPLPFALAWMLGVGVLLRQPSRAAAVITGALLGFGCFSYVSSWLIMPAYFAITVAILWRMGRRDLMLPAIAGFAAPLLLALPWVLLHPDMPGNILAQYQAGESRRSLITAVISASGVSAALRDALSTYWSYFNPSFLFVSGGSSRLVSTGTIGVWPVGVAALQVLGAVHVLRSGVTAWSGILVAGFLIAPLPAALKGEPFAIQRAMTLLPFGVLLAIEGWRAASGTKALLTRAVVLIALATIPFQFAGFLRSYFGDYRSSAARALDPTAFAETAAVLLRELNDGDRAVALTAPLYDVSAKWRFHCGRHGRLDLLSRTRYFSGNLDELRDAPPGTLAVVETSPGQEYGAWTVIAAPVSVWGEAPLTILRRQ